jgi:hypothetical protein
MPETTTPFDRPDAGVFGIPVSMLHHNASRMPPVVHHLDGYHALLLP